MDFKTTRYWFLIKFRYTVFINSIQFFICLKKNKAHIYINIKEHLKILQEAQQLTAAAQASFCGTKTKTKKTTPASQVTSNQNGSGVVSTSESEASRHHVNVETRSTELADVKL